MKELDEMISKSVLTKNINDTTKTQIIIEVTDLENEVINEDILLSQNGCTTPDTNFNPSEKAII